ncbi:MAG: DUF6647 family protein [Alphaproteobacteria bacterium]
MKALVAGLMAWIAAHSSYPVPEHAPLVAMVPHAYLEKMACTGSCTILGLYPDAGVIYIDEDLQVASNVCATSVLLHELVHYAQDLAGRFENQHPIVRWRLREREAHAIQALYLSEHGRTVPFGRDFSVRAFMGPAC